MMTPHARQNSPARGRQKRELNKAAANVRHAGLDVLPELELLRALADLDGGAVRRPTSSSTVFKTVDDGRGK